MNKNTTIGIIILSAIGLIASIMLVTNGVIEHEIGGIIIIFINFVGVVVGALKLQDLDDNRAITIEELRKLKSFGQEQDGTFCDRWEFSIIPIKDKNDNIVKYSFCLFEEVDGRTTRIRYVNTMRELSKVYKAITDKELT